MGTTGFVSSHAFLEHDTGPDHPERPARLLAIREQLSSSGLLDELDHLEPTRPDLRWIRAVHDPDHVESVHQATLHGEPRLDADTAISPGSWEAALLAVGGALESCDRVVSGEWSNDWRGGDTRPCTSRS